MIKPIAATTASEAIGQAFRAAFLLTGSVELAEAAVLTGIAASELNGDLQGSLVAETVASVVQQHPDYRSRLERTLANQPHELRRLIALAPVPRDCFLLRVLFGIPVEKCAPILNLTVEQFHESLHVAFGQLAALGRSDLLTRPGTSHKGALE